MINEELTLTRALEWGKLEEARLLINDGQTIDKKVEPYTKRRIAEQIFNKKAFDLMDYLLEKRFYELDVYELSHFSESIFQAIFDAYPTDEDSLGYLDQLLSKCENLNDDLDGDSLLCHAISSGVTIEIFQRLVLAGCNIQYMTRWNGNLLHVAARIPFSRKPQALTQQIQFLIDEGLDVNAKDVSGNTPIMYSVRNQKEDLIAIFLKAGARLNEPNKEGETAFFYAVADQMNLELYKQLREYELPDFEQRNDRGQTLLFAYVNLMGDHINDQYKELLEQLLDDGADANTHAVSYGKELSVIDLFCKKSIDFLQIAVDRGLIDVHAQDNEGNTLLHKVCAFDINYEREAAREAYSKAKLLLAEGADPNVTNDKDETPLMLASQDNLKAKIVELLISKGAQIR